MPEVQRLIQGLDKLDSLYHLNDAIFIKDMDGEIHFFCVLQFLHVLA